MTTKPIKVRTIIFTEACPLACRYCDLKNDSTFNTSQTMTKEEIFSTIDFFDKQDDPEKIRTRILFSGGEPFLYWDWIKEIIEKYGDRFQYSFNTCGYSFTKEIIEFLSHYDVNFTLSVDGDEKLTNYLRPVQGTKYHTGYMKKLKEIIPTLLFYFPTTPYRIIINPRYVDLIHNMYIEAAKMGFKYFTFIIDFESRPDRTIPKDKKLIYWNELYTEKLIEQFDLILNDIIYGYVRGIAYPEITDVNYVIDFLLRRIKFSPENLPCQVFNNRTLTTLYNTDTEITCMSPSIFPTLKDARNELIKQFNKQNHQCKLDKSCPAFDYCALTCCPQICYAEHGEFFNFDYLECVKNKVVYTTALKLLKICNEICPESPLYQTYLNKFVYPEKEEVLMAI